MRIGVVKEIKPAERRVALTDDGARALEADGHDVLVESGQYGPTVDVPEGADEQTRLLAFLGRRA